MSRRVRSPTAHGRWVDIGDWGRSLTGNTSMNIRFWQAIMLLVLCSGAHAQGAPPTRTVVTTQADLPRHSYVLTTSAASALLDDDAAFNKLAAQVRHDTEATLRDYDIRDPETRAGLYAVLRDLALLRGDTEAEHAYGKEIRASESKPASQLTASLLEDAAATAASTPADKRAAAYRDALTKALDPMPWAVVQEKLAFLKRIAGQPGALAGVRAEVSAALDPLVQSSGRLNDQQARIIISAQAFLEHVVPYSQDTAAVIGGYFASHQANRVNIWPARSVTLSADASLHPVVLAVWDEGVDVALFTGRLFANSTEKLNGKDDDGNGYVDDVHGISFDERDRPAIGPMLHFEDFYPGREAELRDFDNGAMDYRTDQPTAAAAAYFKREAALTGEQLASLMEAAKFYGYYAHGTNVAGIAMAGNPAARLLVVRYNSNAYHVKQPATTEAVARRYAHNVKSIIAYLRAQHVRVVNMSFIDSVEAIERSLEINNVGATPGERTAMAVKNLGIERDAFVEAMRSAPDILFVPGAGNSNTNLGFSPGVPGGIELPNVITAGAVDQYGNAASFTSYGKEVAVYSNGVDVATVSPGGFPGRLSGTSAAAPQVTNLAAKLFALKPSLTPAECAALIRKGATPSSDGKLLLLDPRNTVALLKKTSRAAAISKTTP